MQVLNKLGIENFLNIIKAMHQSLSKCAAQGKD
jgi:hypothetical protein